VSALDSELAPYAANTDKDVAATWDNAHRYTPAPRHRRRLIRDLVAGLPGVETFLDAGCAQPFLVELLAGELGWKGAGCDLSPAVMAQAARELPDCAFAAFDLAHERFPDDRRFDLVICSETLEHISDWQAALTNVVAMADRFVLITVPTGPVRPVDRLMGHYRHYTPSIVTEALERRGCTVIQVKEWGFPVHSAYRWGVHHLGSGKVYDSFAEGREYSRTQIIASDLLYRLFYANDLFRSGTQLLVLARAPRATP
jgi:SAM-dependent methyltransferase